jgi:D-amino-acid oxidase
VEEGREIVVLGLGVSGLSCGVRLCEAGFSVCAVGELAPLESTSAVAAAVWYPYRVGPPERVARWARSSLAEFTRLAELPETGVAWIEGMEVYATEAPLPDWHAVVAQFRRARPEELPPMRRDGFVFRVPRIEMDRYLPWLEARFRSLGGRIEIARVSSLAEPSARSSLVVDCAGLGARELAPDTSVFPIRGQLVRIEAGAVERFVVDETGGADFAFLVPRTHDAILGGTAQEGREDLDPLEADTAGILARCAALESRVARARLLQVRVGLRPGRAEVRLELERRAGGALVVHDYGHGGAGVTLSWGCADEVCELVTGALADHGARA